MTNLIIDDEFRDLLPPLSDDEFKGLEENVLRDGILDPLKVWQGILIDGHHRYRIAQSHNLEFKTVEMQFDSRDDATLWIIRHQLKRRNVPPAVRIRLALLAEPIIAKQAKERMEEGKNQYTSPEDKCPQPTLITPQEKNATDRKNKTNYQLAQMADVSDKTVQRYKKVVQDAPPEVVKKVDRGEISINEGYKEVKRAEKAKSQQAQAERKSYTPPSEVSNDDLKLFCADIRGGLPQIADNSVDFIITDPPYPKEFLPLYEDLSKVAARVLKDGGSLICMTGQSYLPDVIKLLSTKMTYHWCMCYVTMGNKTQLWAKRVHTAWKPLLWFVKGEYKGDWLGDDVMQSPTDDKRFHEWGQSLGGMKAIIERMTNPNDIILDPFLGGGSTGVVAISCKRKFIGVDIEQKNIDVTKSRIKETVSNEFND